MNASNESDPLSLRDIYLRALDRKTPESREAFLDGACGDNLSLRNKVEALLRENAEDSFLESPAIAENETIMDSVLESPGTMVGRYKVLQRIGEGGMGAVYMAEQTEPVSRKVALKIIKLGMDTKQVVARFEAERQALAMMDHPNIAKVLDAGSTDYGRPFFVMELVRGVPITEYCDKNKLTTKERLELFIPVCQAIQHAHQKGIIHRDVKPSNVMVTLHDGNPVPKVIDFGIAKATNQKLTEKTLFTNYSQMIGTPAYMSPEQAEMSGLDVDTRTDVYSLGVLLYELLTGTTPFPSKELLSMGYGEMQRVISETEPPKPSTRMSTMQHEELTVTATRRGIEVSVLQKQFKGDLDWIVMKSLEKDRTHRYETVAELAADVTRHLNNETVNAAAPALSYQIQKLYQRQKKFIRVAAIVFLVLLLGIAGTTWQMIRANQATEQVNRESIKTQEVADLVDRLIRISLPELRSSASPEDSEKFFASLDELATTTLTTNPKVEMILRYNLMVRYRSNDKKRQQIDRGIELARKLNSTVYSDGMPIDLRIWEVYQKAYRQESNEDRKWRDLTELGNKLSTEESPNLSAAIIAYSFACQNFKVEVADPSSILIMEKGLKNAIELEVPYRTQDNQLQCYRKLCSIYIYHKEFLKALPIAERGCELLREEMSSGRERYGLNHTGNLFQLNFLYLHTKRWSEAKSVWTDAAKSTPEGNRTLDIHIRSGLAMNEALQGRFQEASEMMASLINDQDAIAYDWSWGIALQRLLGKHKQAQKLWQQKLLNKGAALERFMAANFVLSAGSDELRNLNETQYALLCDPLKDLDGYFSMVKARLLTMESTHESYQEAIDNLQDFENNKLKTESQWKAYVKFSKAKLFHLLGKKEESMAAYKSGTKTLDEDTVRSDASSGWNHVGLTWIHSLLARQEAEEVMGIPISPLEPAFPPTNHSN